MAMALKEKAEIVDAVLGINYTAAEISDLFSKAEVVGYSRRPDIGPWQLYMRRQQFFAAGRKENIHGQELYAIIQGQAPIEAVQSDLEQIASGILKGGNRFYNTFMLQPESPLLFLAGIALLGVGIGTAYASISNEPGGVGAAIYAGGIVSGLIGAPILKGIRAMNNKKITQGLSEHAVRYNGLSENAIRNFEVFHCSLDMASAIRAEYGQHGSIARVNLSRFT